MTSFEKLTANEKALLLGFLPLLGASTHLGTALTASIICAAGVFLIYLFTPLIRRRFTPSLQWAFIAAIGLSSAYFLAELMQFILPLPESGMIYLYGTGLTPLVFIGAAEKRGFRECSGYLLRCIIFLLLFGLFRELAGSGTLFSSPVWEDGSIPLALFSQSSGAYILFASALFFDYLLRQHKGSDREAVS